MNGDVTPDVAPFWITDLPINTQWFFKTIGIVVLPASDAVVASAALLYWFSDSTKNTSFESPIDL